MMLTRLDCFSFVLIIVVKVCFYGAFGLISFLYLLGSFAINVVFVSLYRYSFPSTRPTRFLTMPQFVDKISYFWPEKVQSFKLCFSILQ